MKVPEVRATFMGLIQLFLISRIKSLAVAVAVAVSRLRCIRQWTETLQTRQGRRRQFKPPVNETQVETIRNCVGRTNVRREKSVSQFFRLK